MAEQQDTFDFQQAFSDALGGQVKLKGDKVAVDSTTGQPLTAFEYIVRHVVAKAESGDLPSIHFLVNMTRQTDSAADEARQQQARQRLRDTIDRMRRELEADDLWCDQDLELEQCARTYLLADTLQEQMNRDGYQDLIQELRKDGTMQLTLNPLHKLADTYRKQFQQEWQTLRADALRRKQMRQMNRRK